MQKLLRVCWRLSGHAAAAAAAAKGRQLVTVRRRVVARPTDLSEDGWVRGVATARTTPTTVRGCQAAVTEEGRGRTTPLHPSRAPTRVGVQGEGEARDDGETEEVESPTATARSVGAAAAVEVMTAEGVTEADTEAAVEAGVAAAAAANLAAAAGSSEANEWQHNRNIIAAKIQKQIQNKSVYNIIILSD